LLVLESIVIFVLLAGEGTRGLWLFALPSALMAGLLWRYHSSATSIALVGLASVCAGGLMVGAVVWASRRSR
jgi:hypothetical protein